jgi:hypothetical protein
VADQFLLTVVWLRHYPTPECLGYLFGVSDATALRAVRRRTGPPVTHAGFRGRLSRRHVPDAILGIAKGNRARDCQGVTSRTAVRLTFRQRRPGRGIPAWDARKPLSPTPGPAGSPAWLSCDSGRFRGQVCQELSGIDMPRSAPPLRLARSAALGRSPPERCPLRPLPPRRAPQGRDLGLVCFVPRHVVP